MYNNNPKKYYIKEYLDSYDTEETILGERYIYNKEKAEENWYKIKSYIYRGLAKPIEFKLTNDGYKIPYGRDSFFHKGELMPDGVISNDSIFYRDHNGDFPWLGNYYNLKYKSLNLGFDLPYLENNIEQEKNLNIYKELPKKFSKEFIKDNKIKPI